MLSSVKSYKWLSAPSSHVDKLKRNSKGFASIDNTSLWTGKSKSWLKRREEMNEKQEDWTLRQALSPSWPWPWAAKYHRLPPQLIEYNYTKKIEAHFVSNLNVIFFGKIYIYIYLSCPLCLFESVFFKLTHQMIFIDFQSVSFTPFFQVTFPNPLASLLP